MGRFLSLSFVYNYNQLFLQTIKILYIFIHILYIYFSRTRIYPVYNYQNR